MLQVIATLSGIIFGAVAMLIGVQNYIRTLNKEWREKLNQEIESKASAQIKEYAAQRDFAHLQKNYNQLTTAIEQVQEENQELKETLVEVKILQTALNNQLSALAARVDSGTSGWSRPVNRE